MRGRLGKRDRMLRGMEWGGEGGELKRLPFFSLEKEIIVRRCDSYKPEKAEKIHRKHFFIMSYVRKTRCRLNDQASGLSQYTQSTVML